MSEQGLHGLALRGDLVWSWSNFFYLFGFGLLVLLLFFVLFLLLSCPVRPSFLRRN